MARPTGWDILGLDGDPTPGVVESVQALAKEFGDFAHDVEAAYHSLNSFGADATALQWVGQTADAFKSQFGPLPGRLQKLYTSYSEASDALSAYWPQLQAAQTKADTALRQAQDAHADLQRATTSATTAAADLKTAQQNQAANPNQKAVTDAQTAHDTAQTNLNNAKAKMAALTKQANDAYNDRINAAKTCASALHKAQGDGIHNKSWWDHVAEDLSEWGGKIAEIANDLAPFLDVLALATSWIPGVDVVTAALAEADNIIAMVGTGMEVLGDAMQGHWGDALMGVGMLGLTLVGGKALEKVGGAAFGALAGKFGKGAEEGLEGAVGAEARSAEGAGSAICKDDPIDVVSGWMLTDAVDLDLPGILPLVLRRAYASGYATGRLFGPGWSSTLDQRLSINEAGIHFAGDDAQRLDYPLPADGGEVLPERGARWPLVWDRDSDEIRITDPWSGHVRHFPTVHFGTEFGQIRDLTAISDRNGNRVEITRDEHGTPVAVEHPGYRIAIDSMPTASGPRITAIRVLDGSEGGIAVKGYHYDERGRLTGIVNSSGLPFVYEWNEDDLITAWCDRVGYRYEYEYDDAKRVVRTIGTDGYLSGSFAYDSANRTTVHTSSLGHATTFRYDEKGHLVSTTDPLGHTVHTLSDDYGRLLTRVDALGHRTAIERDDRGNPVLIRHPDGSRTRVAFNEFNQVVEACLPDTALWRQQYDERGNLLAVVDPTGATTTHEFLANGARTSVTDATGGVSRIETDRAGLPITTVDPLGATTRVVRDCFGRATSVTDPSGAVTEFSWTVEGQLRQRVDPDGQRTGWEYNAEEQVVAVVDPLGGVTRFEPGPFGLVTARTDGDGRRFEFGYDADLNLLQVRDPAGAAWLYTYDAAGRLIAEHDFIGRSLSYAYDAAGQLVERTNGLGERTTLERDAAGRVVGRDTPAGEFAYSYDTAGRMVSAVGPTGSVEFAHDPVGRTVRESVDGRVVAYDYDGAGRQTRRATPSGAVSTWAFDAAGRPVRLDSGADRLDFAFDEAGREIERMLGAGGRVAWGLDAAGRQSSLRLWGRDQPASPDVMASGSAGEQHLVLSRTWSYRPNGVPAEISDSINGTRRYASDGAGRVTGVQAATWTESYAYDGFGNLARADSSLDAAEQGAYEAEKTLIRRHGRTSYEHDAAGRLIRAVRRTLDGRRLTTDYTWDCDDHLTQVVVPDGTVWRYEYDAIGRRSGKTHLAADGTLLETVTFVWEGNRLAEQQSQRPDGSVVALTWDYEPGSFRPAAQTRRTWACDADQAEIDRAFHAIVGDLVGSPTELVAADGTIVWQMTSTVWGRTIGVSAEPDTDCPLRFPGQYFDAETGLHYNYHRYYDPDTAAYLTPDPLGLAPAPNDHAYVPNPLVWLDPLGLEGCVVTVYRAQRAGGHSERVLIDGEGNVSITGENMLHVNMSNNIAHTEAFRGAESQIVAFDVPKTFVEKIQATAIKQRPPSGMSRREFNIFKNGKPQIDDPHVGPDLYGIPHDLFGGSNFSELVSQIVPGSGRVIR